MADGKWINDLSADTPLAEAARRVLRVRFDVVRHYLPLAIDRAQDDVEHVHQLRVATRRARAALDVFQCCLPGKAYDAARKHLRRIRRAAGDARDWDVFLEHLTAPGKVASRHRAGMDLLIGYAISQRAGAQTELTDLGRKERPAEFADAATELLDAVQACDDGSLRTLIDLAVPTLAELWRELSGAAAGDLDDYAHLHQVRIVGKRLRYAMEVFAGCFAVRFRDELYPAVEEMQEILGLANDSHVAIGRLTAILEDVDRLPPAQRKRLRLGIAAPRKRHEQRLTEQADAFRKWWKHWAGSEDFVFAKAV
jgi:CHAD domain-containing protein